MARFEQAISPETISPQMKKVVKGKKIEKAAIATGLLDRRENSQKEVVRGWKKIKGAVAQDLLVFKITQEVTLKMEWTALPENIQTAFTDVLTTVKNKGEVYDTETDGECFVFGFTDETVNLSAVCTMLNGKVAFFYKEEALEGAIR